MSSSLLLYILVALAAIGIIALWLVVRKARRDRRRGRPANANLVIALATAVLAVLMLLYVIYFRVQ